MFSCPTCGYGTVLHLDRTTALALFLRAHRLAASRVRIPLVVADGLAFWFQVAHPGPWLLLRLFLLALLPVALLCIFVALAPAAEDYDERCAYHASLLATHVCPAALAPSAPPIRRLPRARPRRMQF